MMPQGRVPDEAQAAPLANGGLVRFCCVELDVLNRVADAHCTSAKAANDIIINDNRSNSVHEFFSVALMSEFAGLMRL